MLERSLPDLQLTSEEEAAGSPDRAWEQEKREESPHMESTESWNNRIKKTEVIGITDIPMTCYFRWKIRQEIGFKTYFFV